MDGDDSSTCSSDCGLNWVQGPPGQTLGSFFPGSIPTDSRSKGRVMAYSPWRHRPWWIVGGQHTHNPHLHPSHCPARESFQSHLRYNSLPCWGGGICKGQDIWILSRFSRGLAMLGWGQEWFTFAIPFAARLTWLLSPRKWAASSRPSTQALLFTAIDSSPLYWPLPASDGSGCDLAPDSQLWLLFVICPWILANDFSVPHFSLPSSPQSICLLIFRPFSMWTYPSRPLRQTPSPSQPGISPTCWKPCREKPGHFWLLESMSSADWCRPDQTSLQAS